MRNSTTLTTIQRHVGECNTSLIARLKLQTKSIITKSRHEKDEKKTVSNPKLCPLPGRVIIIAVLWGIPLLTLYQESFGNYKVEQKEIYANPNIIRFLVTIQNAKTIKSNESRSCPFVFICSLNRGVQNLQFSRIHVKFGNSIGSNLSV